MVEELELEGFVSLEEDGGGLLEEAEVWGHISTCGVMQSLTTSTTFSAVG
jgi:hypothetical protein